MLPPPAQPAAQAASPPPSWSDKPKHAVVLVHGMGEQMPMETLRGFVESVWVRDPNIDARRPTDPPADCNPIWWKPDSRAGSLELSRVTTRGGHGDGPRTDFYEFYWADLTDANSTIQLKDWFFSLMLRGWGQVPRDVRPVWLLLWATTLVFGGLTAWKALEKVIHWIGLFEGADWTFPTWAATILSIGAGLYGLGIAFVLSYFGDVARYVRAKPPNIAARRAIRERGLALLTALSDSGQYERIILVGHSLGSIIAYDLLRFFWSVRDGARTMATNDILHAACRDCGQAGEALDAADQAAKAAEAPAAELAVAQRQAALEVYRRAQRRVFWALGRAGPSRSWLVSDFVTLGSPLGHAEFLMARDSDGLKQAVDERRFPRSPPVRGEEDGFLYRPARDTAPDIWQAHHAALFAATCWTNIHDPHGLIAFLRGDLISGPVTPRFGPGIVDLSIRMEDAKSWLPSRPFTHTKYWSDLGSGNINLDFLREVLELGRAPGKPQGWVNPPGAALP